MAALYRIDLSYPSGEYVGAVSDLVGPRLIPAWSVARKAAIAAASDRACFAHIIRISGAGGVRRVGTVSPGSVTVSRCNDRFLPGPGAIRYA